MAGGYLEWNVWKNALFSMLLAAIICPGSITFSSFKANKNQRENRNFVNEKLPLGNDCTINYDVSLHATYFTALHNHYIIKFFDTFILQH